MIDVAPETFEQYRYLLFSIAYRMVGSAAEAEDLVQETYVRWHRTLAEGRSDAIHSPKAWLTTAVTRLAIDHLKSARVRREEYVGQWLPEPVVTERAESVEEHAELAESLSFAFLVLLESLSPIERAVFLLHDVFDYGYADIASIVGKTEPNCRQMARRARTQIEERRPRFRASREQHRRLLTQFERAIREGDMPGLLSVLADDATIWADGGGKAAAARKPVTGKERCAIFLSNVGKGVDMRAVSVRQASLNGQPALLVNLHGALFAAFIFDIDGDRIRTMWNVLNPDKLQHLKEG